jgi:formylmethanofuran--tetrahydromethanopterin N-formyltransferase
MQINGVEIEDTFAEAFGMKATRLIITALEIQWARKAAQALTGFATSVIACGVEAAIECELDEKATPDGRPGVSVLFFSVSTKELEKQIPRRVGQCVLTCPTTALFAGIFGEKKIGLGSKIRYFGDGYQIAKAFDGRRFWRMPVMDGEFLVEDTTAVCQAVGGGNFLILAVDQRSALLACDVAAEAMSKLPGVIAPFFGSATRSGSKVGSKYKSLPASTNEAYCPTLRNVVASELSDRDGAVLEVVIDGITEEDVRSAMRTGIEAVCRLGPAKGIRKITAGNYGGKLGQFHFHLHKVLA